MLPMLRTVAMGVLLAAAARADIAWMRDFEKAKERAVREDRLIFLLFDADPCEPVEEMEKDTFSRRDVQEWLNGLVCVRINAETESGNQLATKFGIEGVPTIVLLEPAGCVLHNKGGRPEPEGFVGYFAAVEWNAAIDACNNKDPKGAAPHFFFLHKWFGATKLGKEAEKIRREIENEEAFKAAYDAAEKAYDDALAAVREAAAERLEQAREAARKDEERRAKARELKAEADALHKKYMRTKAYDLYRRILKEYPDLPEAEEARKILEKNKQKVAR